MFVNIKHIFYENYYFEVPMNLNITTGVQIQTCIGLQ